MSHDLEGMAAALAADGKGIVAADGTVPTASPEAQQEGGRRPRAIDHS